MHFLPKPSYEKYRWLILFFITFKWNNFSQISLWNSDKPPVLSGVHITNVSISFTFSLPFSHTSFSSFTFPCTSYRIFLLFLPWLPCHFYLVIEQQTFTYSGKIKLPLPGIFFIEILIKSIHILIICCIRYLLYWCIFLFRHKNIL